MGVFPLSIPLRFARHRNRPAILDYDGRAIVYLEPGDCESLAHRSAEMADLGGLVVTALNNYFGRLPITELKEDDSGHDT